MSIQRLAPTVTTYFIASDGKGAGGIAHYGVIDKGLVVATGQPSLESFALEKGQIS